MPLQQSQPPTQTGAQGAQQTQWGDTQGWQNAGQTEQPWSQGSGAQGAEHTQPQQGQPQHGQPQQGLPPQGQPQQGQPQQGQPPQGQPQQGLPPQGQPQMQPGMAEQGWFGTVMSVISSIPAVVEGVKSVYNAFQGLGGDPQAQGFNFQDLGNQFGQMLPEITKLIQDVLKGARYNIQQLSTQQGWNQMQ